MKSKITPIAFIALSLFFLIFIIIKISLIYCDLASSRPQKGEWLVDYSNDNHVPKAITFNISYHWLWPDIIYLTRQNPNGQTGRLKFKLQRLSYRASNCDDYNPDRKYVFKNSMGWPWIDNPNTPPHNTEHILDLYNYTQPNGNESACIFIVAADADLKIPQLQHIGYAHTHPTQQVQAISQHH